MARGGCRIWLVVWLLGGLRCDRAITAAGLLADDYDVAAANLSAADESSCCDAVAAVLQSTAKCE